MDKGQSKGDGKGDGKSDGKGDGEVMARSNMMQATEWLTEAEIMRLHEDRGVCRGRVSQIILAMDQNRLSSRIVGLTGQVQYRLDTP